MNAIEKGNYDPQVGHLEWGAGLTDRHGSQVKVEICYQRYRGATFSYFSGFLIFSNCGLYDYFSYGNIHISEFLCQSFAMTMYVLELRSISQRSSIKKLGNTFSTFPNFRYV